MSSNCDSRRRALPRMIKIIFEGRVYDVQYDKMIDISDVCEGSCYASETAIGNLIFEHVTARGNVPQS